MYIYIYVYIYIYTHRCIGACQHLTQGADTPALLLSYISNKTYCVMYYAILWCYFIYYDLLHTATATTTTTTTNDNTTTTTNDK